MEAVGLTFGVPGVGEFILPHADGAKHLQPMGRVSGGGPVGRRGPTGEGGGRLGCWRWRHQGPRHVAITHGSGSWAGHLPHTGQSGHGQRLWAGVQCLGWHVHHHAAQWLGWRLWERVVAWHQWELGPHVGRQRGGHPNNRSLHIHCWAEGGRLGHTVGVCDQGGLAPGGHRGHPWPSACKRDRGNVSGWGVHTHWAIQRDEILTFRNSHI